MSREVDADDLLWNWARWCWSGETVGNMARHIVDADDYLPINHNLAKVVDSMHKGLPHHEGMVITAEYPQKNAMFADLTEKKRQSAARKWIGGVTGVWLTEVEYKLYLGFFKNEVERRLL